MTILARITAALLIMILGAAARAAPLEQIGSIPMPGVKGRIDHFTIDLATRRLFVAALGNGTVEVFDLQANRHARSIAGFGEPQGLLYVPATRRLFVANGTADRVDVLDGESLRTIKRIDRLSDADNLRYDAAAGNVVVGYGTGALRFMDRASGDTVREIAVPGHPESFQLENNGTRIFVNLRGERYLAVVDREKGRVIDTWDLAGTRAHFPMALDPEGKRLFVGARSPAAMLVYDTASGKIASKLPICGDTDDIFFDKQRKRLYVVCGEGKIDVFVEGSSGKFAREARLETARGARTGLFVPEYQRLYVAAPAAGPAPARLLIFETR